MSIESVAIALNHSKATGTAKLVMIGIANHDGDGGSWPSIATLARYANVDARSVQRAIDRLEQLNEVHRVPQAGGTQQTPNNMRPNLYRLLLECPKYCDRTAQHKDIRKPLVSLEDELSTGVTPVSPGDASVTPGVTPVSPEPSFNQTIRLKEKTQVNARAFKSCPQGHELIDDRHCIMGCLPELVNA